MSDVSELIGLTTAEVIACQEAGLTNAQGKESNRSYKDILRENFLTFINGVFFFISLVLVILGRPGDVIAIVLVVFLNTIISVIQEMRAKQQLDQIALLTRPRVTVIRDRQEQIIDPAAVVQGDILLAQPGDQIVVDGVVVGSGQMQVDESLLTGESDRIVKQAGDGVYSGSFCVSGSAAYRAEKVGAASTANQLTAEAKVHHRKLTPLQREINLIIRVILALAIFLWILVLLSLLVGLTSFAMSVQTAAVVAGLVPVGLYLTITLAYALGALRISQQQVLVQQANAMESLSSVDVLCLDKTGTLTTNELQLQEIHPLGGVEKETIRAYLADFAASSTSPNQTSLALGAACPGPARPLRLEIPFSSAYKWSAQGFASESHSYLLGAPDVLLPVDQRSEEVDLYLESGMAQGLRVLLFAQAATDPQWPEGSENPELPANRIPLAVLWIGDRLRPDCETVLGRFQQAGIDVKIISGDHAGTVKALAKQVGMPAGAIAVSGADLAQMDDPTFEQTAVDATIFGRITPDQKAKLVKSLRQRGRHVAMIGDGVNDVLSLKQANVGIAMESGSAITRNVADIVLLEDAFSALPAAFREGQRIYNGIQDVTKLFMVRVFSFALLSLITVMAGRAFPLLIVHNSLLTLLGVGIPTLGVAYWAIPGPRSHKSLIRSLLHFVLPATISVTLVGILVYLGYIAWQMTPLFEILQGSLSLEEATRIITVNDLRHSLTIARTALVTALMFCSLILILFLKPPARMWVGGSPLSGNKRYVTLVLTMAAAFIWVMFWPPLRRFFDLDLLRFIDFGFIGLVVLAWALGLRSFWRYRVLDRFLGVDLR
ncbi:HAD-IC family P-type ATPase [Candidatus Synechococcus calcipolaris G9]|uniref:HAD-IC family P-type ATPase n=1 Tax=Candidatus Synechococcus calcipolaris G9 TaxID=1497997 RepID=A0ABT6EWW9_9SYNE|nr:HAD-IC family P-type ATPase [Candidatus Synechococcus calcipolaris]MDG2990266.1 HAD-IC family P-type ATPase [Candidatus Synechococcus calcipolaris G9]